MADSQNDKLFRAEYAKSGQASCKKCKEKIAKDSLRMAIVVQVSSGGPRKHPTAELFLQTHLFTKQLQQM
uniref:PARP-type domain-containing protein n=1 Tax=Oryzias latipes TaxID=8090 RepID=A0A3P9M7A5_ORYLA